MRNLLSWTIVASLLVAVAAPAGSAPAAPAHPQASLSSTLGLRLRSIELQIDILNDRALIGREEAQDLRREARRLEQRLYRSNSREAGDIAVAVQRLQDQLRLAAADVGMGTDFSRRRDLGRFDDGDRYARDRESYSDRDSYRRPDPRGDPFEIWRERDERGPH